jgi:DNA-binding PadR family transcriptional regulator
MSKEYLGELEELILTMVGLLEEDAYGNAIIKEIREQVNREVSLAAAHVTLYRLERKGYIRSRVGGATKTRGGRRKRIFTITHSGLSVLRAMKEDRVKLWKLVPRLSSN